MAKKKANKKKKVIASNSRATKEDPASDLKPVELPQEPVKTKPEREATEGYPVTYAEPSELPPEPVEIEPEADVMDEELEAPVPEPVPESVPEPVEIEYNQPITSPYEYPIATVRIGTKSYGIPVYYPQKHPHFKRYWDYNPGGEVVLRDVDEDIGHTIIHFLYTGRYETLYSGYDLAAEYRRGAEAYEAARKYDLFGLETAAREQIEYFSPHVQLQTILETAREILPNLPADETWFKNYLKEYCANSFDESRNFFQREELVDAMGQNTAFDKTIMRLTVNIMFSRISELEDTVELLTKQEPTTDPESEPESESGPVPYPATQSESESLLDAGPESAADEPATNPPEDKDEGKETIVDVGFAEEELPAVKPGIYAALPKYDYHDQDGSHDPVEVFEDGVPSPRPQSLVEIPSGPELLSAPMRYGLGWREQKSQKKGSLAVEEVAQPRPITADWE